MRKEIKEKQKSLNDNYSSFLSKVLRYASMQNVSKLAYLSLRDQIIEKIYEGQNEGVTPEKVFKHGYENYVNKKMKSIPKKSILETVFSFTFVFFVLFSFLAIFVYGLRFIPSFQTNTFYSKGIYLYVLFDNLALMSLYGFLGVLVSIMFIKGDQRRKNIELLVAAALGLVIVGGFFIASQIITTPIKLNMIVLICLFVLIAGLSYFMEYYVSKKRSKVYLESKNREE